MAIGKNLGSNAQSSNDFLIPHTPVIDSVTDVGTNRAYNDGAVTVAFTLPAASPAADSYTVTANATGLNPVVVTGASSPLTITGLSSATSYTVTISAENEWGTSETSAPSSAVAVTTVPATVAAPTVSSPAPSAPANTAGATQDVVSWTAPANGGKSITQYTWTSSDGKTGTTTSTSVTVNQEGGTAQTYQVRAENANGVGVYSTASSSVTTFSFTPFSFVPFGAFNFTPFAAFNFTPFGAFNFVPFNAFNFTPFGAFGFTPFNFVPFRAFGFTPFGFVPR
jgi:hypothetical protein